MNIDTPWFVERITRSRYGSQRQLALAIGSSPSHLSLMLNGHQPVTLQAAAAIAKALEVPLLEVLERAGYEVGSRRAPRDPLSHVPADIRAILTRADAKDPLWDAIRALDKFRRAH